MYVKTRLSKMESVYEGTESPFFIIVSFFNSLCCNTTHAITYSVCVGV